MVEVGESSGSHMWAKLEFKIIIEEDYLFGKLKPFRSPCWGVGKPFCPFVVPSDSKYFEIDLSSSEELISSEILSCSQEKHKWCKIIRSADLCSVTLQNKSALPILVDNALIESEEVVHVTCGTEITSGPKREGYISYRLKLMPVEETPKQQFKIPIEVEHAKCSICLNIWHDVVTVAPCLHNFCNGCFSEWLKRSQKKYSTVLCPQCRAVVGSAGKNHFLQNIEEGMLQADPSLRRSAEEIAVLDSYATIKTNLVIASGKGLNRKRMHARLREESEDENDPLGSDDAGIQCPQCETQMGGFRCNQNAFHLRCHACGGMMPSRTDITTPQHCLGCDRVFCGAYWHDHHASRSNIHPMCSRENFKPIREYRISRIPLIAHEGNRHEQDVTERCIGQTGKALQEVVADWIHKLDNREIDRTRMPLNHAEMITSSTSICNNCYEKLVSFLLYWFRISVPKYLLPADVTQREDCWYGYACRTQHHNEEHARKRNHVCRPTRGA